VLPPIRRRGSYIAAATSSESEVGMKEGQVREAIVAIAMYSG
jgi:hypothetical protein